MCSNIQETSSLSRKHFSNLFENKVGESNLRKDLLRLLLLNESLNQNV